MGYPSKLLNRDYVLFWVGQTTSLLGVQAFSIAAVFWIKHATDSATAMGLMQMLSSLPALLLGPIGGAFADRHCRRDIIVWSDVSRAVAILVLTGLIFLMPGAETLLLSALLVVAVLLSLVSAFFSPTLNAYVPDLVPQKRIGSANAMVQLSFQLSVFVGQGLGGTLFQLLGAPLLFLLNGATYLFAAITAFMISIPGTVPKQEDKQRGQLAGFRQDIVEGFRFIWRRVGLRQLVFASAFLTFFTTPVIVLLPFYIEDVLQVGAEWYGFLLAAYGIGSLGGYLLAGSGKLSRKAKGQWMIVFFVLESAGYGLLGLVRDPIPAVILALLGGIAGGFVAINITTTVQITTPSRVRGRIFGLLATVSGALYPIAAGVSGIVTDLLGQNIPLIYLACGAIMLVLSSAVSFDREFRAYLAYEQDDTVPAGSPESAVTG